MDPASRNRVLLVGGALIVIALLLVCGPAQFDMGPKSEAPAPPVAAAPPPVVPDLEVEFPPEADVDELHTGGGSPLADAPLSDERKADGRKTAIEPTKTAPAPIPAPLAPATIVDARPKAAPRSSALPQVAAPGPPVVAPVTAATPAAEPPAPTPQERAANAAQDFDESFGEVPTLASSSVVDRFAPPVDSGPRPSNFKPSDGGFNSFAIRPCDSPGAGCQNVRLPRRAIKPPHNGGGAR